MLALKDKTFFADLVLVRIYESPTHDNLFKYRPINSDGQAADGEDVQGWKTPVDGRLKSIRLYATRRLENCNLL